MYPVLDLSDWKYEDFVVSGSKTKRWYRRPQDNLLSLFKLPVSLTSDNWTAVTEMSGEIWSEKISSELGRRIGINTHHVDVGYVVATDEVLEHYNIKKEKVQDGRIYGAICYSFLKENEESLIEGADMIMDFDITYDRQKLRGDLESYNYELLLKVFNKHNCKEDLFKMITLDILVGNTDRHQDNFGLIYNEKNGFITFAPLYDNASSLGRELTQRSIDLMFKDPEMFKAYIFGKKSRSLIKLNDDRKVNMFDFLKEVKAISPEMGEVIQVVRLLTDDAVNGIVELFPDHIMNIYQKKFVIKLITSRRDYLLREFL